MAQKRVILSDSSLNRYGFRVITSGLDIEAFKKNPVMLWMHQRDDGFWTTSIPIGHWEDIQIIGDELSAIPVFDEADELSKTLKAKYDAGTLRAASIGFKPLLLSEETADLLPGQSSATVLKAEVLEASLVDIPANGNAVRLYNENAVCLSANQHQSLIPKLSIKSNNSMKLLSVWTSFISLLGYKADTELKSEDFTKIHEEMTRLNAEVTSLSADKQAAESKVTELSTQLSTKDSEITTLKGTVTERDSTITQLTEQVKNLQNGTVDDGSKIKPEGGEQTSDDEVTEELKFLEAHKDDTLAILNYYKTK